jgi:hypothetical protein
MSSTSLALPLPLEPCTEKRFLCFEGERVRECDEHKIRRLVTFFPEGFRLELPKALRRAITGDDAWPDEDDDRAASEKLRREAEAHDAGLPHTLENGVVVDDVLRVVLWLADPEGHTPRDRILMPHVILRNIRGSLESDAPPSPSSLTNE